MIQRKKMLQCLVNTLGVVDTNVGRVGAGLAGIHKYCGDVPASQFGNQTWVGLRRHDCYAVHLALHHPPYATRHALGVVVRVSDDYFLAALHRLVLEALHQLRKERIGDVGDDQS